MNLAEVLSKLGDGGENPRGGHGTIGVLPLEVTPFDEDLAVETARLRPLTVKTGLSLAHRACLHWQRRGLRVPTADEAWQDLKLGVQVALIR